ncbi:Tyrosine-protein kinase EpsD [hydrothermal vent metagenome]|uniref:non-specific protein-tyrosine kinase n=1 Tax=hydrothermal vent metagenome TaxID=652676 RepID=A0A3B0W864_9ZZZZ
MEHQLTEVAHNKRTIGHLLLEAGKLKPQDADLIVKTQQEQGLRFGDAAVQLGFVTEADIMQVVSQQFDYSCLSVGDESIDPCVLTAFYSYGPEVEALRALRSQLSFRWFTENKSLVITAPAPKQGSSYIAANLAVLFAQLGQSTLLIDANMRQPTQQQLFRVESREGLSDVLVRRAGLDVIQSVSKIKNLSLLLSGTIPPNPLELLGHSRFNALMSQLEERYDVIIIDSPAMLEHSDAQAMSSVTKATLLVVSKNETKITDLELAKQQILIAGADAVGVVLNSLK